VPRNFSARLARIEKALADELVAELGIRHFVSVDNGQTYAETTPALKPERRAQGLPAFDHGLAIMGLAGHLPDELPRYIAADLDRFGAEGWQCIAIVYVDMQTP
jgi:hypothetical protein